MEYRMSRKIYRVPAAFAEYGYDGWGDDEGEHEFTGAAGETPPEGDCYQVWQDVSEETPISPVFATREECVTWVMDSHECSAAAAEKFIDDGWAPSFIGTQFGLYSGVQMAAGLAAHLAHIAPDGSHPSGTRIRHVETGIEGAVAFRMPAPNADYYGVCWDRGLPHLLAEDPTLDPDKPMEAGCRIDGFEVLSAVSS